MAYELYHTENAEVLQHYRTLDKALDSNEYEGMKILIFQPVALGDVVCSSLCAELFQIKYPGCTVDYLTEFEVIKSAIQHNPFIDNIIVNKDWNLFTIRDTLEAGELRKEYDMTYSLYWWSKNLVTSFLASLELPTDYTRVKLYPCHEYKDEIKKSDKLKIALQDKEDIKTKWNIDNGNFEELKKGLENLGEVIKIDKTRKCDLNIEIIRNCDLFVGAEGALTHMAGAVGCQTVSLSSIYDPNMVAPMSYQNKYLPLDKRHRSVRPINWCGDTHCIDFDNRRKILTSPPYGFSSEGNFPPYKFMDCDYNGFKKSCIHEITPAQWLNEIYEVIKLK